MFSHVITAVFSGLLSTIVTLNYPTQEGTLSKIGDRFLEIEKEGIAILEKIQQPILQKVVEESSRNWDYLINAKPFGIKNGVPKMTVACTALYLTYYGYTKYQENQNKKDDSKKQEHAQ